MHCGARSFAPCYSQDSLTIVNAVKSATVTRCDASNEVRHAAVVSDTDTCTSMLIAEADDAMLQQGL